MHGEDKEYYKHKRSKSYATQRDAQPKENEIINMNIKRNNQVPFQINNKNTNFSKYAKMSMTDLQQRKRILMSSIGNTESMDTQASTAGNTMAMPRCSSIMYNKKYQLNSQQVSQGNLSVHDIQKYLPTTNFSTLPDSVYESVENIYPQFKQKVVLQRNKEKSEYEKNKEEVTQRYRNELYKNDKYLYCSEQQLLQIQEKSQLDLFKKEIEIQQRTLDSREKEKQAELQVKKYPNIWKMVRHFQETKAQDVADLLRMKDFQFEEREDLTKSSMNEKQYRKEEKGIQRKQGYASATISSQNFVRNQLQQANKGQTNQEGNLRKSVPIQSFLEKECKKARMMAEELEIQQMLRNGVNANNNENTSCFNDASKINTKIKKYCKLIRPTGASLSNRVDQKFVDNNMKYFLVSSTIEMDQKEKIALKQDFEKNKTLTHNFGNSIKKTQQSKVMEEYVKQNETNVSQDYLNDNVILFPTELDQILQSQEFVQSSNLNAFQNSESLYENNSKGQTESRYLAQAIQEEELYDNLSTPPKSERRVSIPKIINGRITLEVKNFIKKNLPQTKHYVHFRSRKDKRSVSAIGNKYSNNNHLNKDHQQEISMKDYLPFSEAGRSISRCEGLNQSSIYDRKQDSKRSQLSSAHYNQSRSESVHDTHQQFVTDSQSKINEILSSCTQIQKETYEEEDDCGGKKRTVKDVINAMEKLRDNKTQKIKERLMNESELVEQNDIKQLAEGQKVLTYLEEQIDKSQWEKKIQDKEHEHKKDLLRQQLKQIQGSNLVKVSQITAIHKKKIERSRIQQKCFIQSQEKQLSKYINLADFIGFK